MWGLALVGAESAQKPRGARFLTMFFPLHTGSYWGWPGRVLMMVSALSLTGFFITGLWLFVRRPRRPGAVAVNGSPGTAHPDH